MEEIGNFSVLITSPTQIERKGKSEVITIDSGALRERCKYLILSKGSAAKGNIGLISYHSLLNPSRRTKPDEQNFKKGSLLTLTKIRRAKPEEQE